MKFKDVRQKGFGRRISIQNAITISINSFQKFPKESLSLQTNNVNKRILREDLYAKRSIPPFNRSTKDGFSVKTSDIEGASKDNPVLLSVIDEVIIGEASSKELINGTCVQIPTGGAVPQGSDSIVMLEDTSWLSDSEIEVYAETRIGENISLAGSDFEEGELIFENGKRFSVPDRGFLLSAGVTRIKVSQKPSIAIIASGDELLNPWNEIQHGKVPEINTINLYDLCLREKWLPKNLGILPDNKEIIKKILIEAVSAYDVVLLSGGTSVGKKDYIPVIFNELGEILWHGVAIRPGGPTSCASINGKLVFGLPGFPTSTFIAFNFLVRPVMNSLLGLKAIHDTTIVRARILDDVKSTLDRRDFLRVKLRRNDIGEFEAVPITLGKTGLLRNVVKANGIVQIPEQVERIQKGDYVEVFLIGNI
ncbi:MAG: molybdopterin molybdotransferase MoeA [Candidatus Hodarchaeales archaeon]|jgi:molybdenum cofactor synthesis domain-containing protein